MAHSKKEELLATQMHQLMDVPTFNRWFIHYNENKRRILNEDSIPTLAEFLSKNDKPVGYNETLYCKNDGTGFARQSASFQKLKRLLVKHKIRDHWIVLEQPKRQLSLFPMTVLKHRDVSELPFVLVCNVKAKSSTYQQFTGLFPKSSSSEITVAQVLAIDQADIETITGVGPLWRLDYVQVQAFRTFILLAQKKLRAAGFSEKDGSFLTISFAKKKKVSDVDSYEKKRRQKEQRASYGKSLRLTIKDYYRYA